ncbi:MAG: hypothetical protein RLY86_3732 [Pseudomonadota bacterium]|jgi:chemotaxis protein MotB
MAGGGNDKAPIIIKRIKKGEEGHHGGAWKVAYADFVTAMMAFFLLLWLLNVTTAEQKMGIADFFSPASPSKQESGAGSVLGGQTITVDGAQVNASSPPQITVPTPSIPASGNAQEQVEDFTDSAPGRPTEQDLTGRGAGEKPGGLGEVEGLAALEAAGQRDAADTNRDGRVDSQELQEALARLEQQRFEEAVKQLRQAIQSVPELQTLAESLIIDQTPEGLRIQLVDQFGYSMFPSGGARMLPQTAQLMGAVAQAVRQLPNRLSISGHTDGIPFRQGAGYSNWELSSDRANASRRALEAAGISPDRFESVNAMADRDHLFPEDPNSPRNRRISIVLLREQPGGAVGPAPAGR